MVAIESCFIISVFERKDESHDEENCLGKKCNVRFIGCVCFRGKPKHMGAGIYGYGIWKHSYDNG